MAKVKLTPGHKPAPSLKARVARNIATRRQALLWTQAQLANAVGVDPETVSRYERGKSLPSLEALERLAEALGSDLSQLVASTPAQAPDDAQHMAARLKDLSAADRGLVLAVVDSMVRHMTQRAAD